VQDGLNRRLICVGLEEFGSAAVETEETTVKTWASLRRAGSQVEALARSFRRLGYGCTVLDGRTSADDLGSAVQAAIREAGPTDVLVIHILSHGTISPSGALRAVGADGRDSELTEIDRWLRQVVDAEDRAPMVLFLLDICFAGSAARLGWQQHLSDSAARAWVIAACGPVERAFGGRFTEAVTEVNRALASGELDIDSSYRHAPITTVAQRIRRTVTRAASAADLLAQQVTASLVDISTNPAELPFFPNFQYSDNPRRIAGMAIDTALRPFLDDLDEALDPIHFLGRASGHGSASMEAVTGCFSGRGRELRILSPWLNLQDQIGLRVVTGSPGVGKSALIGVLVCAAHPQLRGPTEPVWHHIEQAPYRNDSFAAVHARKRGLAQVLSSIARQLTGREAGEIAAADLVALVARLPHPPVIVVDALDEAVDGEAIMRVLLLPLTQTTCLDGRPARVMVGMRPWAEFAPLIEAARQSGGLVDLDQVSPTQLREDLTRYVSSLLLSDRRWSRREYVGASYSLAHAVAEKLTDGSAEQEWGAFLVAGLFTSHVIRSYAQPVADTTRALELGATVPRSLPELLDLDMRTRGLGDDVRSVLVALAHAKGEGMPAEVVRNVAAVSGSADPMVMTSLLDALDSVRFYLRHGADPVDGTTLYRLFHQGLADHLGSDADHVGIFDRMIALVGRSAESEVRRWDVALPYLIRHIADHARQAGQLDKILNDVGFLVFAEPAVIREAIAHAQPPLNRTIEIYHSSMRDEHTEQLEHRRFTFAVGLIRGGAPALAREIVEMPGLDPLPLRPRWSRSASGDQRVTAAFLSDPVVFLGSADGRVAILDFATGSLVRHTVRPHDGPVTAVSVGQAFGHEVVASAGVDRMVLIHDVSTGEQIGEGISVESAAELLSVQEIGGRPTVLVVDSSTEAKVFDLRTGNRWGTLRKPLTIPAVATGNDEVWLSEFRGNEIRLKTGHDSGLTLRHDADVTAATMGTYQSSPVAFTGDEAGELRAWSVETGEVIAAAQVGAPITDLRSGEYGDVLATLDEELLGLSLSATTVRPASARRMIMFPATDAAQAASGKSRRPAPPGRPKAALAQSSKWRHVAPSPSGMSSPGTQNGDVACFCGSKRPYVTCHGSVPPLAPGSTTDS